MRLTVKAERFPIAGGFTISRGSKSHADVVVAELEEGGLVGRGECVPYARYGETIDGVCAQISELSGHLTAGLTRDDLQAAMPAGAARNAIDCALWDIEAKRAGVPVAKRAGVALPDQAVTAMTISLGTPEAMGARARELAHYPLLKVKLGGDGDAKRLIAIRNCAPDARLIVDANEAWTPEMLPQLMALCAEIGVEMIEQPLPAGADHHLAGISRSVPVCADESCHDRDGLAALKDRYDAVNIKLDKTGGLTEALALAQAARAEGLDVMVGCMLATSLAMAPALLLAPMARWVDLDGPALLEADRPGGLVIERGTIAPLSCSLWG